MTALNGTPELAQHIGGLAALPGLEAVTEQLTGVIAVLRAEQARRQAGIQISRPAWKNLVFTGGPGTGKSRAARAVACLPGTGPPPLRAADRDRRRGPDGYDNPGDQDPRRRSNTAHR
jgi:hypothetical protein